MKRWLTFAGILFLFLTASIGHPSEFTLNFDDLPAAHTAISNGYGGLAWSNFDVRDGTKTGELAPVRAGVVSTNNVLAITQRVPATIYS
jgi:hypothetical protein